MRNDRNEYFTAFISAWEELFDFKLPRLFNCDGEVPANRLTAAAFIWCGALTGGLVALTASLIQLIFNVHLAALFFVSAAFLLLSCKDSCRGDIMIRKHLAATLNNCTTTQNSGNMVIGYLLFFARLTLLIILAYGGAMWYLPLLLAGAFSVQAFLAISLDAPVPLLPDGFHTRRALIFALLILVFIGFFASPMLTLAAIAATALVYTTQSSRCRRHGFTAENLSLAGYIAEWALLIAAAAFL